ncbi:alpha/beta hydrolase family protein [Streptomyces sp. NBC_01754]|uniref:alpha/beta hydrolase n=1 Tax=Streptomyces sp. NBC_01754 TaxID=2975930 RepID=UPI002DD957F9|nr:alpha/beta hydrolase [Streptomyces sp. NBC_01754]WSC92276.1 alpha/beta hydrolase family protein [Streptomyces sp. NBC_01754]
MTSFDSSPTLTAWRALLAVAVVFVMLTTTGWTAVHRQHTAAPREIALAAWARARVGGHPLPDAGAPAHRLARFFATLTARQQSLLADTYPLVVGNMNGAPVTLRYRANRHALTRAEAVEQHRAHDTGLSRDGRHHALLRLERFRSLLAEDRQILAFDPSGRGLAAEVLGDLDRAERVSVVVPGIDTNLLTLERTGLKKNAAPVGMARSLYGAERAARPGTRTAVIAWADYTAPAGLGVDAVLGGLAANGAVRLNSLLAALPGPSTVSLFCHSYGSVLCGLAARGLPDRVSDIAVAGSPGMRADSAAGLGTGARVWATRDGDDWIKDVPNMEIAGLGHGADPVDPRFGARLVSASGAVGHSGYFEPGTESLSNFAAIGVGAYDSVSCASADRSCRRGFSGGRHA